MVIKDNLKNLITNPNSILESHKNYIEMTGKKITIPNYLRKVWIVDQISEEEHKNMCEIMKTFRMSDNQYIDMLEKLIDENESSEIPANVMLGMLKKLNSEG